MAVQFCLAFVAGIQVVVLSVGIVIPQERFIEFCLIGNQRTGSLALP